MARPFHFAFDQDLREGMIAMAIVCSMQCHYAEWPDQSQHFRLPNYLAESRNGFVLTMMAKQQKTNLHHHWRNHPISLHQFLAKQ